MLTTEKKVIRYPLLSFHLTQICHFLKLVFKYFISTFYKMSSEANTNPNNKNPDFGEIFYSKSPFCPEKPEREYNDGEQHFIKRIIMENIKENNLTNLLAGIEKENPYNYGRSFDANLCWALREFKRSEFLESKRRQYRRETDLGLKDLENSIRSGYVAKIIAAQNADNHILARNKKELEKAEDDFLIDKAKFTFAEFEEIQSQQESHKNEEYKRILFEQMNDKCKNKELEYQDYLKDKQSVHDYMANEEESHRQEILRKKELQNLCKLEMEDCLRQRAEWLRLKKLESEEEDRRIAAQVVSKDEDIRKAKEEKRRIQAAKEQISERIGREIHALQLEKKARQDFLQDLLVEERQALDDLRQRENAEKSIYDRNIMVATVAQFTAERKAEEDREKKRETEQYIEYMRKTMEDDRLKEEKKVQEQERRIAEVSAENARVLLAKRINLSAYKTGKIKQGVLDQQECQRK